jgi:hypothetical protein
MTKINVHMRDNIITKINVQMRENIITKINVHVRDNIMTKIKFSNERQSHYIVSHLNILF